MNYLILLLSAALLLGGCASFTQPDNEIRITEYGGDGQYFPFVAGEVGGVRVVQTGAVDACIEYAGTRAKVKAGRCPESRQGFNLTPVLPAQ